MNRVRAYCSACDTIVEVRVEEGESGQLDLEDLDCPHAVLCGPEDCAKTIGKRSLREVLEFLPADAGESPERGLGAAGRMVEDARRASMSRERRRWLKWWGGR